MNSCYSDAVEFSDPVFIDLKGERAKAMWRMLCERGKDLKIIFTGIEADDRAGRAHWEATYSFSATGRKVVNSIDAVFQFANGKIVRHVDQFDLWKWSGMALGFQGKLLGWTPFMQNAIRRKANHSLEVYMEKKQARL